MSETYDVDGTQVTLGRSLPRLEEAVLALGNAYEARLKAELDLESFETNRRSANSQQLLAQSNAQKFNVAQDFALMQQADDDGVPTWERLKIKRDEAKVAYRRAELEHEVAWAAAGVGPYPVR